LQGLEHFREQLNCEWGVFDYNMEICFSWGIWGLDVVWPVHVTLVWQAKCGRKWGTGFIPIAEYRSEFMKPAKNRKACKPIRLLYSGSNHYDLLI
jgi:hypothetical protein